MAMKTDSSYSSKENWTVSIDGLKNNIHISEHSVSSIFNFIPSAAHHRFSTLRYFTFLHRFSTVIDTLHFYTGFQPSRIFYISTQDQSHTKAHGIRKSCSASWPFKNCMPNNEQKYKFFHSTFSKWVKTFRSSFRVILTQDARAQGAV